MIFLNQVFRQIVCYLAELFRQIVVVVVVLFSLAIKYIDTFLPAEDIVLIVLLL